MYYIAIIAPEAIDEQVKSWKLYLRDHFGCIVALKSPAHLTLISPFWMNTELQQALQNSMQEFSSSQHGFTLQLKNFDSFKPRVIFVQVMQSDNLLQLKNILEKHLLAHSQFPIKEARAFHPHITLANRDLQKKDFGTAWEHFNKKNYETSFLVEGITLMKHNGLQWEPVHHAIFPLIYNQT